MFWSPPWSTSLTGHSSHSLKVLHEPPTPFSIVLCCYGKFSHIFVISIFLFFSQNARRNKWMEAREHFLYPLMHITKPCRGSSYILAVAHRHCMREASVFADWMFGEARSPWGCSWTGRNPNPPPSPLHGPQTGRSRETEGCWSLKRRRMNCWRAMLLKLQTNWRIIILQQHFSWRISSPCWSIWEKISGH